MSLDASRGDKRAKTVSMTDEGFQVLERGQTGLIPDLPERLSDVPADQLRNVTQTLRLVIGILDDLRQLDASR